MGFSGYDMDGKQAIQEGKWSPPRTPARRFLAVDPGDVHVGLAEFAQYEGKPWRVVWAGEMLPVDFLQWFADGVSSSKWQWVVVEEWRLFPEHAPRAIGSDMPTSRLIGGMEALVLYLRSRQWLAGVGDFLVFQSPKIKVPTRSWLKRRKLRSVAKILQITGDHAMDAELHGYYWLVQREEPVWSIREQTDNHPELSKRHDLW